VYYIGLDVGTGSTRACLIDDKGDILGVATKDIKTWHEKADYYVENPLHRADFRNNPRTTYGTPAVMSPNKSLKKPVWSLRQSKE